MKRRDFLPESSAGAVFLACPPHNAAYRVHAGLSKYDGSCGVWCHATLGGHAMCDANPRSFEYVCKVIDFVLGGFDFAGVHLESCDLGCCFCPKCAGGDGLVGYNARINQKTADYIKRKWPEKTVYVITI